jgi:hypothetical protein
MFSFILNTGNGHLLVPKMLLEHFGQIGFIPAFLTIAGTDFQTLPKIFLKFFLVQPIQENVPIVINSYHFIMLEKGKPSESLGRKATGLSPNLKGYGSRAAGRMQHLLEAVSRTAKLV